MTGDLLGRVGVVAIGRNEGERLRQCLRSIPKDVRQVVYVDSGSTDESVSLAKSHGAAVVELDPAIPFTAARGRNAGVHRLVELAPDVEFVQVVDGDCELVDGFIEAALHELASRPDVAVVCGRRRERYPEASIYNRLCDMEWGAPAIGDAVACGGDAVIRLRAFQDVSGYDDQLIAGEEPDMCFRLRRSGWKIRRIAAEMTLHDAQMSRFGQWWKRALRGGHATAELFYRHGRSPERFRARQVRSTVAWALALPALAGGLTCVTGGTSLVLIGGYGALWYRIRRRCLRDGYSAPDATLYASHCVLSKFPELVGMAQFMLTRLTGRRSTIIEYKRARSGSASPRPAGT